MEGEGVWSEMVMCEERYKGMCEGEGVWSEMVMCEERYKGMCEGEYVPVDELRGWVKEGEHESVRW